MFASVTQDALKPLFLIKMKALSIEEKMDAVSEQLPKEVRLTALGKHQNWDRREAAVENVNEWMVETASEWKKVFIKTHF